MCFFVCVWGCVHGEDCLPARLFLVVYPAVLLECCVDHLAEALHQAAHGRLQPAGVGVEQDDGAKATQLAFLLKEFYKYIFKSSVLIKVNCDIVNCFHQISDKQSKVKKNRNSDEQSS